MNSSCILCVLRVLVVIFFTAMKNIKNKGFIKQIDRVGAYKTLI